MKKILASLLTFAMLAACLLAFSACGEGPQTVFMPEPKGTLRLGFDSEYPPYGYLDTDANEYAGFDIDLAKAVCSEIGYKLELVPIDWNMKDAELSAGTIDCIWSGFTMDSVEADGVNRLEKYTWSGAYSDNSIVILVKGDSIQSTANLAGKTVKVQAGSSGEAALKDKTALVSTFRGGKYETAADYTTAFAELESGSVDALVIDIGVANALISGKTGYNILSEKIATEQYGIGFKLGNTALRDTIWNAILALDSSVISGIAEKYGLTDSIIIGK